MTNTACGSRSSDDGHYRQAYILEDPLMHTIISITGGNARNVILRTIFASLLASGTPHAQMIYTKEDDLSVLTAKQTYQSSALGIEGKTLALGPPGTGKDFDLTAFTFSKPCSIPEPGAEPCSGTMTYPRATHRYIHSWGIYPSLNETVYYWMVNDSGRFFLGRTTWWPDISMNNHSIWTPPYPEYVFPCTVGTHWNFTGRMDKIENGTDSLEYSYASAAAAEVAGSGILRLPDRSYDCLHIKRMDTTRGARYGSHEFLTRSRLRVVVSIDSNDIFSENPRITHVDVYTNYPPTPVELPYTPNALRLLENAPNPFAGSTEVRYSLQGAAVVRLSVFDALGGELAVLASGHKPAGTHMARWDAMDQSGGILPSGVYLCRLIAEYPAGRPLMLEHVMILLR